MTDLFDLVAQFCAQYDSLDSAAFSFGGDSYVLLFLGYRPQKECALMVDNYYPAYQRVRNARLQLEAVLQKADFSLEEVTVPYKALALLSGKTRALRNCLTAHTSFGSWHVMEVVRISGVHAPAVAVPYAMSDEHVSALADRDNPLCAEAWQTLTRLAMHPACEGCDKCLRACPTGALRDGFAKTKCLRQWQAEGFVPDEAVAAKMGQRVLGCHTCQLVCPVNTAAPVAPEVDGNALFAAAQTGKTALVSFVDCLGYNYLRPVVLTALCLNALGNARDDSARALAPAIAQRFSDERIRRALSRYLRQTAELEREVKRLIGPDDYRTLSAMAEAAAATRATQVNHYFGVRGHEHGRIRLKDGVYTLTVKVRLDEQSRYEHNARLSPDVAEQCLQTGLSAAMVKAYLGLDWQQDAPYIGSLTTVRTTWVQDGLTMELDDNTYCDRRDYEIECEVQSDGQWCQAERWIRQNAPSATVGVGKQQRFEQAKGL